MGKLLRPGDSERPEYWRGIFDDIYNGDFDGDTEQLLMQAASQLSNLLTRYDLAERALQARAIGNDAAALRWLDELAKFYVRG